MNIKMILGIPALLGALATVLPGCAGVVIAGAGTAAYVASQNRTTGTVIDDENIDLKASTAIREDKQLADQAHISVTSFNYVVLLTGEAPTAELRERAERLAAKAPKVQSVYNEVIIAAPSSMGSRSTDTWITTKAKTALVGAEGLEAWDATRVKVVTERGTVYLMGLVTRQEGEAATEAVRRVDGVQRVVRLFQYTDTPTSPTPAS